MENIRYEVKVFAFKDNKIVCIKYKNVNKDYFDIPGGKIEDGETEVQACIRTFKEETGMDVDNLRCIGKVEIVSLTQERKTIMKTYIASQVNGTPQDLENNYTYWLPINELVKKEERFAITNLMNEDLIKYFTEEKLNITFTCDDDNNIVDMKIN